MVYVLIALVIVVVAVLVGVGLLVGRSRRPAPPTEAPPAAPPVATRPEGTVAGPTTIPVPVPPESTAGPIPEPVVEPDPALAEVPGLVEAPELIEVPEPVEVPEPTAGRLVRLRHRLARSQSTLGRGLLTLLSRERLDEDVWEEIEDTLLTADVGVAATIDIVDRLRIRTKVLGTRSEPELRGLLAEELLAALGPDVDRGLATTRHDDRPAVLLVIGVNGTGKTTTCGKLARVLVADGRTVLLGAADTFRAAAADQLQTWGSRVGAQTVRGPAGGDPASVAFDAVKRGTEAGVDAVVIDTAGRLHAKIDLMDELRKIRRVVAKHGRLDETLLVLDATVGQNGLVQARAFTEAVDVTGIVLTKLDGTAKGGIVISVQREIGIPVKLVGLGEGPDDLAPFEPKAFVDALLGG